MNRTNTESSDGRDAVRGGSYSDAVGANGVAMLALNSMGLKRPSAA